MIVHIKRVIWRFDWWSLKSCNSTQEKKTVTSSTNLKSHTNSTQQTYKLWETCKYFKRNMKLNSFNLQILHYRCCHKDHLEESDISTLPYDWQKLHNAFDARFALTHLSPKTIEYFYNSVVVYISTTKFFSIYINFHLRNFKAR